MKSLLFAPDDQSLFKFIDHFADAVIEDEGADEAYEAMSNEEKIAKLLLDGDKERMIPLVEEARKEIEPDKIVNEILIDAMKVVGELFGSGTDAVAVCTTVCRDHENHGRLPEPLFD